MTPPPMSTSWNGEERRQADRRRKPTGCRRFLTPRVVFSLWLTVITGLVAVALIADHQDDVNRDKDNEAVRLNQCQAYRDAVTERVLILQSSEQNGQESAVGAFWRKHYIPSLQERFTRAQCAEVTDVGELPSLEEEKRRQNGGGP